MQTETPDCLERRSLGISPENKAISTNGQPAESRMPRAAQPAARRQGRRSRSRSRNWRRQRRLQICKALFRAVFGFRGSRRRTATILSLVCVCLLVAGWRGFGRWPGHTQANPADHSQAGAQAGRPAPSQPLLTPGAEDTGLLAGGTLSRPAGIGGLAAADSAISGVRPSADAITTAATSSSSHPTPSAGNASGATIGTGRDAQTLFPGIADSVARKWSFPMKITPNTPSIGVFGASRSNGRLHAGIDLYAPQGTPIHAMTAGRVRQVEVFYQGLMAIEVENSDGTTIRYCELANTVHIGNRVSQGQLLGHLKRNYDGTCMLHLEIYAHIRPAPLTQIDNKSDYPLVPGKSRPFRRRSDLVDPSAVYNLPKPAESAGR